MKAVQRIFIPGDEWVYFKIYTGITVADRILAHALFPAIKKMIKNKVIEKFYFIRYTDPDFHLRLRFLASDHTKVCEVVDVINKVLKPGVNKQFIWKIQLDTYQREIERYHPSLMIDTESIFYFDSLCIIKIISRLNTMAEENYRWMISLAMIDKFLSDWNFALEEKRDLMISLSNAFKTEFGFDKYNSKQFNEKYRVNKLTVELVLNNQITDTKYTELVDLLNKRSVEYKNIIHTMQQTLVAEKLNIRTYMGSYLHMTLNRLFAADNRLYELVVYDFMKRYYASQVAINNQPVHS